MKNDCQTQTVPGTNDCQTQTVNETNHCQTQTVTETNVKQRQSEPKRKDSMTQTFDNFDKILSSQRANKKNSNLFRNFTGFTYNTFIALFKFFMLSSAISPKCMLKAEDQFFLCLVKLKLDINFDCLGFLFGVCRTTASNYFHSVINIIYFKSINIPICPSRENVNRCMPPSFYSNFPGLRTIIDCTEIFIDQPSSVIEQQATFSVYKNHNTLKALIGIAPSGAISFVSPLFTGSISDKEITLQSGILDKLEQGDLVLADKGFGSLVGDFNSRGVKLVTPGYLLESQFTIFERRHNQKVSTIRVHVERAIGRIKIFKMFSSTLKYKSLQDIDHVFFVCCFLANFMDPLINL